MELEVLRRQAWALRAAGCSPDRRGRREVDPHLALPVPV